MSQRLLIVFFTAVVFAAGFGARLWTESVKPVAPPPVVAAGVDPKAPVPPRRGPLSADFLRFVRQVSEGGELYRKGVSAIDAEFDTAFAALLDPKQLEAWTVNQQRMAGRGGGRGAGRGNEAGRGAELKIAEAKPGEPKVAEKSPEPRPLSPEEIERLRRQPLNDVGRMLSIKDRLETLTRNYSLDEKQQSLTKTLLMARRDKFIALTEGLSPAAITYSSLARELDRLALTVEGVTPVDPKAGAKPEASKVEVPK